MIEFLLSYVSDLKDEEKKYVFSLICKVYVEKTNKNESQKKLVQFLSQYFDVKEPQIDVCFENLDKIENELIHKITLYFIYELLYLETIDFEFEENDSLSEIFDCFSVKKSFIKQIKENILSNEELLAYYKELMSAKKNTVLPEQLKKDIHKFLVEKQSSNGFDWNMKYKSKTEFEKLFVYDAKMTVQKYYRNNTVNIINEYINSLNAINDYISKRFSIDDAWFESESKDFQDTCINNSQIGNSFDFGEYVLFSEKHDILVFGGRSLKKAGSYWSLNGDAFNKFKNAINKQMEQIESLIYSTYMTEIDYIINYYSDNYMLIDHSNMSSAFIDLKSIEERIEFIDELKLNKKDLLEYLDNNILKYTPIVSEADSYNVVDYSNGKILFSTTTYIGDILNRKQSFNICSLDLMKNMNKHLTFNTKTNSEWSIVKSVSTIDNIYFIVKYTADTQMDEETCYFPMEFKLHENIIINIESNQKAIKMVEPNKYIFGGCFIDIKNNDLHVGRYDYSGNIDEEYIVENIMPREESEITKSISDAELINKFKSLSDDLSEILIKEDQSGNCLGTYMLGELYFKNTKYKKMNEEKAFDLWNKGRNNNLYCRTRDMINNKHLYTEEDMSKIITDLTNDPYPTIANYLLYICYKHKICTSLFTIKDAEKFLLSLSESGNWLASHSLCLYLREQKDFTHLRDLCKMLIKKGIYSNLDMYLDTFFCGENLIDRNEYTNLLNATKFIKDNIVNFEDFFVFNDKSFPEIVIYSGAKDPLLYSDYNRNKTFSTKSAAEAYTTKYYNLYCEYLRNFFNSSNSYFINYIGQNVEAMKDQIKSTMIYRAFNEIPYKNINIKEIEKTIYDSIYRISNSFDVSEFYAEKYIQHSFTDMNMTGGFFSKREWNDFVSTGALDNDFKNKRNEFQTQIKNEMLKILSQI